MGPSHRFPIALHCGLGSVQSSLFLSANCTPHLPMHGRTPDFFRCSCITVIHVLYTKPTTPTWILASTRSLILCSYIPSWIGLPVVPCAASLLGHALLYAQITNSRGGVRYTVFFVFIHETKVHYGICNMIDSFVFA